MAGDRDYDGPLAEVNAHIEAIKATDDVTPRQEAIRKAGGSEEASHTFMREISHQLHVKMRREPGSSEVAAFDIFGNEETWQQYFEQGRLDDLNEIVAAINEGLKESHAIAVRLLNGKFTYLGSGLIDHSQ